MIEFKRNPKTGIVEVWKDGKKTGEVSTMGDEIMDTDPEARKKDRHGTSNLSQQSRRDRKSYG